MFVDFLAILYFLTLCLCTTVFALQTEHDTVEVIGFLKQEDAEKDQEVECLKQKVKDLLMMAQIDKSELILDHKTRMDQLHSRVCSRDKEVNETNLYYNLSHSINYQGRDFYGVVL